MIVLYARYPGDASIRASPGAFRLLVEAQHTRQAFVLAQKCVRSKNGGFGIRRVDHSQMQDAASYFFGAQAPYPFKEGTMSQHSAQVSEYMTPEQIEAIKNLENKVEPKLSTSLDSGALNVSASILGKLREAGYTTLEKARQAGEDILNISGVGPKTLEKIQGIEEPEITEEEPIEVAEHAPEPEGFKGEPIGFPDARAEALAELKEKNIHFKETKEGRVRVTAGYFVLTPPEGMKTSSGQIVKKCTVRSYNPKIWHGWKVTGWNPTKFK